MGKLLFLTVIFSCLQCYGVTSLRRETYSISLFVTSALANFQWKTPARKELSDKPFQLRIIDNKEEDEYTSINLIKDDEINDHISTWSIKTINSTSNTSKSEINFTVTDGELNKCFNKLGISNTTEPHLVYLCFLWSKEPYYMLWIPIAFAILIYFIFPIFNTTMYIRNIKMSARTSIGTGFLKLAGRNQFFTKNIKPKGRTVFVILAITCVVTITLLIISLYVFYMDLVFDQTSASSHSVYIIKMNKGTRISLATFSCLSFLLLPAFQPYYSSLSLPLCTLLYHKIIILFSEVRKNSLDLLVVLLLPQLILLLLPLLPLCSYWYKKVIIPFSEVGKTTLFHSLIILLTRLVLFLLTVVFFLVEFATFLLLNMSFLIVYKMPFFISDIFTYLIVFLLSFGTQEINLGHILSFAFLTQIEKTAWISKVNEYSTNISERLHTNCFYTYLTKNSTVTTNSQVSILHTGSIPSQLGKPLMLLGDLPRVISDSFPELRSDHDVMFSLDHLPVSESQLSQEYNMFRITIQADRPEFVYLHTNEDLDQDPAVEECRVENTEASKFMVKVISETFFTPEGKMTKEARAIPALSDISEPCSCLLSCLHRDYSDKFLVERAGPSVNLKITLQRGYVILDCDFLLSLPLTKWPSPAQEWLTRERKWPDSSTVARLAALPCHIIPKPRNEKDTESWRFSFSNQELELTTSLPEKARLCYIGLKLIFKKYLKNICPQLKSYHMLTMFLWFMEQQDPECWDEESTMDNGEESLLVKSFELGTRRVETKGILQELLLHVSNSLHSGYLHHFFIRDVNLHPGNSKEMNKLVTRIENIVQNGIDRLLGEKLVYDVSILNPSLFQRLLQERL